MARISEEESTAEVAEGRGEGGNQRKLSYVSMFCKQMSELTEQSSGFRIPLRVLVSPD
jgi:hypothetical protein